MFLLSRLLSALNRVWTSSLGRFFFIMHFSTFGLFLPIILYNVPFSLYYLQTASERQSKALEIINTERLSSSYEFLRKLSSSKLNHLLDSTGKHVESTDVAITIITVARNSYHQMGNYEPKYLTQVVAKYIQLLQEARQNQLHMKINLTVCNVDSDPNNYVELKNVSQFVNVVTKYSKLTLSLDHILEKEKSDYAFCLQSALKTNSKYVLLVEDDAYPLDSLFPILDFTIKYRYNLTFSKGELKKADERLAFIKLYHPERILNYLNAYEPDRLTELFGAGFVLSSILTLITKRFFKQSTLVLSSLWIFYSIGVIFCIGRANMLEILRFHPQLYRYVKSPGCCTPALLFKREGAEALVKYLNNIKCGKDYPKDKAIEDFLRIHKWIAKLISPNLFVHIGQYSSLGEKKVNPYLV